MLVCAASRVTATSARFVASTHPTTSSSSSFFSSRTMSQVVKTITKPGDGKNFPRPGDRITMHYVGRLTTGAEFDSSIKRGRPFVTEIGVGKLIKGWDECVPTMSLGEKATLNIPSSKAYGPGGIPGTIPPNADLIFDVELLKIN